MEENMPVSKRELAFEAERPGVNAGDWWHLVLDPEVPGIYVEHTWTRTNAVMDRATPGGMERYGINDFLTLAKDGPARSALIAVLGEMFPECVPSRWQGTSSCRPDPGTGDDRLPGRTDH
jgi:hypothetical protein